MSSEKQKVTLEALQKFLGIDGKACTNKTTGKNYYKFPCPKCKEIGRDSDGNHLTFYPEKGFPVCYFKNEHGIAIYKEIKEILEREEDEQKY